MTGLSSRRGGPSGFWLVVTNNQGELIFQDTYTNEDDNQNAWSRTLIQTDDNGFLLGCESFREGRFPHLFTMTKVTADGEPVWWNTYGGNDGGSCYAVIELKSGEYAGAGWVDGRGYLVITDEEGEVNDEWSYDEFGIDNIRENEEGILLCGDAPSGGALAQVNENGEIEWIHIYEDTGFTALTSCIDGSYAILGHRVVEDLDWFLLKVNRQGGVLFENTFDLNGDDEEYSLCEVPDGGFVLVGSAEGQNDAHNRPYIVRTDRSGNEIWRREDRHRMVENNVDDTYQGVVYSADNEVIISGVTVRDRQFATDGLLLKLYIPFENPQFIEYTPEQPYINLLVSEQLEFIATAEAYSDNDFLYYWLLDNDTIETDTDAVANYNYFSEFDTLQSISLWAVNRYGSANLTWHVTVTDLYVSHYSPDSLNLTLRRGQSVDFALDTVRAVEGDPVQYSWQVSRAENVEEAGRDALLHYQFLQSGQYSVEGLAYRGESSDAVTWSVDVRGVVWSFAPEDLSLEVLPDSLIRFEVIPTNPGDTTLSERWFVDDDHVLADTLSLDWLFSYPVHSVHTVHLVLSDSVESDTVLWKVTVRDPNMAGDKRDDYPTRVEFLSVAPNPFNSTLTIKYKSVASAKSAVNIYDISGREVARLVDLSTAVTAPSVTESHDKAVTRGGMTAERMVTWNAEGLPGGIYFVRIESGAGINTIKTILLK